ncbi:MAG: hypothetical protein JWM93_1364 [Frankiales bacterium]|nr:hypothetical protein [Frankiales bacterium]
MTFPGTPVVVPLPAGSLLLRIYDSRYYGDGTGFRYFGPHRAGRWDHHAPGTPAHDAAHGVLYLTPSFTCAVAEAYGDARVVAPAPYHRLSIVQVTRTLLLADTTGRAAVELGVPAGALRARDRPLTQGIARDLYDGTAAEGVRYEGYFTGDPCVALWERSHDALELLDDRGFDDPAVAADALVIAAELHYAAGDLGPF